MSHNALVVCIQERGGEGGTRGSEADRLYRKADRLYNYVGKQDMHVICWKPLSGCFHGDIYEGRNGETKSLSCCGSLINCREGGKPIVACRDGGKPSCL